MSRYFNITITGGTSPGPYSVYYDFNANDHLAKLYPSNIPASGLSSSLSYLIAAPDWTCQSGYTFVADTTQPNGIGYCSIGGCPACTTPSGYDTFGNPLCFASLNGCSTPEPISISKIIIYNETCKTSQTFDVGVIQQQQTCFCLTVKTGSTYNVWNSTYQFQFCSTGNILHGKPTYQTTISAVTYTMSWDSVYSRWYIANSIGQYMPLPGQNIGDSFMYSYDPSSLPLSNWNIYFPNLNTPPFNTISAASGNCANPLTLSSLFGDQLASYNPIDITCTQTNPTCFGVNDGAIISKATGGYGGWTYSTDGIYYTNSTGIFTNLSAGTYTIYASDISGNITSCNVTLIAAKETVYQLPILLRGGTKLINNINNFNYYKTEFIIDNTLIPNNVILTFDFSITYSYSYIQPGSVNFDSGNIELSINNNSQIIQLINSTPLSAAGTSPCSPAVYKKFVGSDEFIATGITINNTDIINGYITFGIDTATDGQFISPCITSGTVSVTAKINNLQISTINNAKTCATVSPRTVVITKTQIASSTN